MSISGGSPPGESPLSRRRVIGASLGVIAGATIARHAGADSNTLSAVITLNGQTYQHRQDTGQDLGDFVSTIGGFTQHCIRGDAAGSPLTVYFRPDAASDRAEIVFENCSVFTKTPANLGAYSVAIYQGSSLLATVDVPEHYYNSRWRWQSSPRPIVANIDQLIAQGLLPPYDRSAVSGATTATPQATSTTSASASSTSTASISTTPSASSTPPPTTSSPPTSTTPSTSGTSTPPATQPANTAPAPVSAASAASAAIAYLRSLLGAGFALSSGDRRPGMLETVAIGTAIGALAAKALQMEAAHGDDGASGAEVVTTNPIYTYTPMTLAGVTPYMPQTGERDDIGMLTEQQARYVCTAAADALQITLAQAEASGTVPWHMRDNSTNAPISFQTYPQATWYWESNAGSPWIATTTTPITPDSAHMPALSYLPYLLTGDPYHLEELQFVSTWVWGSAPSAYRPSIAQSRAFAWFMRTLSQTVRMTPASVPSWLLPQAYWANLLEQNRLFLEASYVNNPSPVTSVFRSTNNLQGEEDDGPSAPAGTWIDPWQEEFVASVLGWMINMGFTEWQTAFDWKIGSTIARTGTTSGWVRAYATPYRVILRETATSQTVQSWADAWTLTDQFQQVGTIADPNTWAEGDMTYLSYSRGSLVFAANLGTVGAADNLAWATGQLNAQQWDTYYKWRIGTGLNMSLPD